MSKSTLFGFEKPVSVEEYALQEKISEWYVRYLCRNKKIKCVKIGQTWFIDGSQKWKSGE